MAAPDHDHPRLLGQAPLDAEALNALSAFLTACRDDDATARAELLLTKFGSLSAIVAADIPALRPILPDSSSAAPLIAAARALMVASLRADLRAQPALASGAAVVEYIRCLLDHERREVLRVLYLNSQLRLLVDELVSIGSIASTAVPYREIVRRALETGASGLIMAHNHPSGDASPSREDIAVTRRLASIVSDLDIRLVDHVIVSGQGWTSLAAKGFM